MVNKLTLTEIYRDTFRRSTLISIPNLTEFFTIPGSGYTHWEVFYGIVYEALKKFDYYFPLNLIQQFYLQVDSTSRKAQLTGNFEGYINGIVCENQICIVPAAVQGISLNGYTASGYPMRNFRYEPPEFRDFWYSSGVYWGNTTCYRPMYEEYDPVTKKPTDRCAVYYMNKDVDTEYKVFRDQVYLEVCRYIMNMKKNMLLQNMPIDLFQGLEEDYNKVESQLDQTYNNSLQASAWLI